MIAINNPRGPTVPTRQMAGAADPQHHVRHWVESRPAAMPSFSLALYRLARNEAFVEPGGNAHPVYQRVKRTMDLLGALGLLVALSPVMLTALVILSVTTQGRPIFRQQRIGYLGRRFWMYKFRTMRLDADKVQHLVRNEKDGPIFKNRRDPRITRLGRILRATSIDELPQLINVLCGHMALVGPRPPVAAEVQKYLPWQRRRLSVRPGLTCLWQISGRSEVGFEDWVRMDLWYLRHQGLWTDCTLLVRTPLKVLSCRGAY